MNSRRTFLTVMASVLAIGAACFWGSGHLNSAKPAAPEPGRLPAAAPRAPTASEAAGATGLLACQHADEEPAWCVRYGEEFWHRRAGSGEPRPNAASLAAQPRPALNLGAVIARVSHAFNIAPGTPPAVRSGTYAAALDGSQLRFSPYRPPQAGPAAPAAPTTSPGEQELANSAARTPETPEEEDALMARLAASATAESGVQSTPRRASDAGPAQAQQADALRRPQPDGQVEAAFETVSIRRGDQVLFAADQSPLQWAVLGNTAQRRLDPASGLVEHFEAASEGIAVTWILPRVLTGKDSLVVEARLSGLAFAGQTAGGLHFADGTGTARVRIGSVTAVDSAGTSWSLPMEFRENSLRVTVPAAVLAQATYPLALDPLISAEFGMDAPVLVAAPAAQQLPAVAANAGSFLVVWEDYRNAGTNGANIFGTRVTGAGAVSDPNGIPISPAGASTPTVAANGKGFLVAWADARNAARTGMDIFGARVSSAGEVTDPGGFAISTAIGDQLSPAATANGADTFVVWQDGRNVDTAPDIFGARVTSGGAVSDPGGIPIGAGVGIQATPAVAFNGANFLVVWADQRGAGDFNIYGARVTPAGAVLDGKGIPISTFSGGEFYPKVASVGASYLVVWEDHRNAASGGFVDVFAGRVGSDGSVLDRAGFPVGTAAGDRFAPAVAGGQNDYLVVWQDSRNLATSGMDIFAARVTTAGGVMDPSGIAVSTATGDQSSPAVAFNGSGYLAAWTDARNFATSDLDIYGALIGGDGSVATPAGILLSAGSSDEQRPAVASNGSNYLVVWQDFRDSATSGVDLYGVRVSTTGAVLDPSAIAITTAASDQLRPAVAASGDNYLVVWEDFRNSVTNGADIYGARVTGAGVVVDTAGLPISSGAADQLSPAVTGNGNDYFVVWQDGRNLPNTGTDIFGARVSSAGAVLDSKGIPLAAALGAQYSPAVAFNGANYLVVWADERNLGVSGVDIYGTRVTPAGGVLDSDGLPITRAMGEDVFPAVASAGGDFLVVWEDGRNSATTADDIFGARVTGGGAVLDVSGIAIAVAPEFQAAPAVAASGTNYLVVWQDARNSTTTGVDIYGARVTTGGAVSDPAGLALNAGPSNQQFPKLASGSPRAFLVVCQSLEGGASRAVANLVLLDDFPVITQITVSGGSASVTWVSAPSRTYRVQFKPDLGALTPWSDLSGDVTATGATATKVDATFGSASQRFYRVVLLP